MRRVRPGPGDGRGFLAYLFILLPVAIGAAAVSPADVVRVKDGRVVEGRIVARSATALTVRTPTGLVTIAADQVDAVEPGPSVFDEYEDRRKAAAETADAQTELARWCGERGLTGERTKHLQRAVALDPNHAAARAELGHVRIGGLWVEPGTAGRPAATQPASRRARREASAPAAADGDDEAAIRAAQGAWMRRINAIKTSLLDASLDRLVKDGRERILAIKDPLAILPLVKLLGKGSVTCRQVLVESLGQFADDEATMNLAVLALADRSESVRGGAIAHLVRRNDERVVAQFRKALSSGEEALILRAAVALGEMKRSEAVPDLIDVLTVRKRMKVETPVAKYFGEMPRAFASGDDIQLGGASVSVRRRPQIGLADGTGLVTIEMEPRLRDVTVFRTEVRDALRAITGQDFAFEEEAWRRWYQEYDR